MGLRLGVRRVFFRGLVFFVGCNGKGKKKGWRKRKFHRRKFHTKNMCLVLVTGHSRREKKYKIKWQLWQNIFQQMTAWFVVNKKKLTKFPDSILGGARVLGRLFSVGKKPMGKSTQPFQPKRPGAAKGIAVSVPLGGLDPKLPWENRAPKDWKVAFVPWGWFGVSPIF